VRLGIDAAASAADRRPLPGARAAWISRSAFSPLARDARVIVCDEPGVSPRSRTRDGRQNEAVGRGNARRLGDGMWSHMVATLAVAAIHRLVRRVCFCQFSEYCA